MSTFREIEWSPGAEKDYLLWDAKTRQRIDALIDSIYRDGLLGGIGKPERLKYALSGCYSRRISREHRLVYRIDGEVLQVIQCRLHY